MPARDDHVTDCAARLPERCIHELFAEQAARTPEATALVFGEQRLSYRELDARGNRLAHHLRLLGVASEEHVAVCAERSIELIVALLAILKAGGAYLPLDPASPAERLRFMLRDGRVRTLLGASEHAGLGRSVEHWVDLADTAALASYPDTDPGAGAVRSQLAYVCYTSGSTGVPNGVEVPHLGVLALLIGVGYVRLDASRVVLHAAPAAFDATTFEVWGPLLHGGRCVLLPERVPTAGVLRRTIAQHGVTTAFLTTALVNAIVDEDPGALAGLDQLLFGGERVSVGHVHRLQRACPRLELVHCYGPTETTTFATSYRVAGPVDAGQITLPIGRPLEHATLHVLTEGGQHVLPGEVGQAFVGGCGVARGYLGRPELTAARFLPDPFGEPGARLYRTGDMVRLLASGDVEFVERIDHQVKLRGHRIELGEIETRLAALPEVAEALVLCREDRPGDKRLVAYVVPRDGGPLPLPELRSALRTVLPDFMLPKHWVELARLPLTANGKIDRRALPAPDLDGAPRERDYLAPSRTIERELAELLRELIGVRRPGVDDDFFDLGGNSLLATRLLARLRERYEVELSVAAFYQAPTIAALAPRIEALLYAREGEARRATGAPREELWI